MLTKTTLAIAAASLLGFASMAMAAPKHRAAAPKHYTYHAKHIQRGNNVRALRATAYRQDLRLQGNFGDLPAKSGPAGVGACSGRDPDSSVRLSLIRECQEGF